MSRFNLARLYEAAARPDEATVHWQQLVSGVERLPSAIGSVVCHQPGATTAAACIAAAEVDVVAAPWQWPLRLKGLAPVSPKVLRQALDGWVKREFDWIKDHLHGYIYSRFNGGAAVLELDQFVQMQVLRGDSLAVGTELSRYCGRPLRRRSLPLGEVSSCDDWAALADGNKVKEVWWIAR